MNIATDSRGTFSKSGVGYTYTLDGVTYGEVFKSGATWRMTLSAELRSQFAAKFNAREREFMGMIGGYSRNEAADRLVEVVTAMTERAAV
jgi:hypothetical protein